MSLKPYDKLETYERNQPCLEYPGEWLVYVGGNQETPCDSFEDALRLGHQLWDASTSTAIDISWKCSDNDPRIGEVWFTGFYVCGQIDSFGCYRST